MAIAIAASMSAGCLGDPSEDETGSISMDLQIAPGVTINTVSWTIDNAATGFTRSSSVNVQYSNQIQFQTGNIPAGSGYTIALTAVSVDGSLTCTGSAGFAVMTATVSPVAVALNCSTTQPGGGAIAVTGTTQICASLDSVEASPLETAVDRPVSLSAVAAAG